MSCAMQARLYDLLEEAICKHEPPDVRRLRPDVPGWLGATVAAMLARQAAARPTAERMAGELRNGKSSPAEQDAESHRSVLGAVTGLFGKSRAERPARSASQPRDSRLKAATATLGREFTQHREARTRLAGPGCSDAHGSRSALQTKPDHADAHYNLGVAYGQQGRTDEAIREYQAALRINPDVCRSALQPGRDLRATGPHR